MDPSKLHTHPEVARILERRRFLKNAAAGTLLVALGGGTYVVAAADDPRAKTQRPDGRPRLPPGQRIIDALKPMGGDPGDPSPASFKLHVHGEVENPVTLDFAKLLALPQTDLTCDVHCVTGWSMFDATWRGVQLAELAKLVRVRSTARYVIFEAANSYTSNVRLSEALAPGVLVAHQHGGKPLSRPHGPPARALVPDLYFWKSAKWLTGIRFSARDRPGYWETRGYHNHADPWKEERYG
ncbi:molybdopterin-dependent oxidoreductase [Chondromyces apiculatus]|uniref:Sulfite oxidase n=1 Tax=Chondromyces apiculatus DSM 436 TaxID=1192034 RepID=A0A017SWM3_9BACT|nr:molybdopterin-dependent oxidoreductase [Chondromyces apiculatus]EYF01152.1 Sulfite oxidase [Chondromyces apiculatus DSM 436]